MDCGDCRKLWMPVARSRDTDIVLGWGGGGGAAGGCE